MQASKILFSAEELRCAEDREFILTKNGIIRKIVSLFASLSENYRALAEETQQHLPPEFFTLSPKISRGEQYLGLPYVMLDFPRIFSKEDVLAIRTFFWWGNYFSLTLHVKGKYKNELGEKIKQNIHLLRNNNYCLAVSEDEWRQDFEEENYVSLGSGGSELLNKVIREKSFLKLAANLPLQRSNEIIPLLKEQYSMLLKVISG